MNTAPATQKTNTQERKPHPLTQLYEQMEGAAEQFRYALPPQISPQRFIRAARTAVQRNPLLLACNRPSFFNALMSACNDGCLPDGIEGVILPYKDNVANSPTKGQYLARWQRMIQGDLKRFRNSGEFKDLTLGLVREGDAFKHWIDENGEHLNHTPENETGKVTHAYAIAHLLSGGMMMKVMTRADIEKRRNVSQQKNGPMWRDWWEEGALKTVLRNLTKRLPASSDNLEKLIEQDQEIFGGGDEIETDHRKQITSVMGALDHFGGAPDETPAADGGPESQSDPSGTGDAPPLQPRGPDETGQEPQTDAPADQRQPEEMKLIEVACERGAQAKRDGMQRRAIPPEYRDKGREAEAAAWHEGWDQPDGKPV